MVDARGFTIRVESLLVTEECYSCHVLFAFPEELKTELLRVRGARQFYCPNGHALHYIGEPEEARLRRELERKQRDLESEQRRSQRLSEDNMDLAKANRTLKGGLTKLKKRAANGVCAFCHRHFADMQRHVESKHAIEAQQLKAE